MSASKYKVIASLVLVVTIASGCTRKGDTPRVGATETHVTTTSSPSVQSSVQSAGGDTSVATVGAKAHTGNPSSALSVVLTNATPPSSVPTKGKDPVKGEPLTATQIEAVTQRLPKWDSALATQAAFRWPAATLTVPRSGTTKEKSFGNDTSTPPKSPTQELKVVRVQPMSSEAGDVSIVPFVAVTFNQPMVPLATVEQLAATEVPVKISPQVPGTWRWIGTSTVRFDFAPSKSSQADGTAIDRLPMATKYIVEVPTGVKSALGETLKSPQTFTFETPAARVVSFMPSDVTTLDLTPVFVAQFDQQIDPVAVLEKISLTADDEAVALRLATEEEIKAAQKTEFIYTEASAKGRWLAFRPVSKLRPNQQLRITVGPGVPSNEGPILSEAAQSFSDSTYPKFTLNAANCDSGAECPPGSSLNLEFSTNIDPVRFSPEQVAITPAIPGAVINVVGNYLIVSGETKARTKYTVSVPASFTDIFGQQLGTNQSRELQIGAAVAQLRGLGEGMITVDPNVANPQVSVVTVNHTALHMYAYEVSPTDWAKYQKYTAEFVNGVGSEKPAIPKPPFRKVADKLVQIEKQQDTSVETTIDLSSLLTRGVGNVVVIVETVERYKPNDREFWNNRPTMAWVQSTKIGLDSFLDSQATRIWTTDLRNGSPLEGVQVKAGTFQVVTNKQGAAQGPPNIGMITASKGDDVAFLPVELELHASDSLSWYVLDDRGTYRPGETVSMKGWVRHNTAVDGQVRLAQPKEIEFLVTDAAGVELTKGTAEVTRLGGFTMQVKLPEGANAGPAYVELKADHDEQSVGAHSFAVQDFRRPEFEVKATVESPTPIVSAASASVALNASYFSGGPLVGSPVQWQVTTSDASYSPAGWDQFTFGVWVPWWFAFDGSGGGYRAGGKFVPGGRQSEVKNFAGVTGQDGAHHLKIDFAGADGALPDLPKTVEARGSVTDVNRQEFGSTATMIVHPSKYYVGIRTARPFVKKGDPLDIEVIATDVDGKAVTGKEVSLVVSRSSWSYKNGIWAEEFVEPQTCEKTSVATAQTCSFSTAVGGSYKVVAKIADEQGGKNRSELTVWVTGDTGKPTRNLERESLTLVPTKRTYNPGENAEVLVQAPFAEGHGYLTISRVNTTSTQVFELKNGTAVLTIPVTDGDIPGLDLFAEVVGTAPRVDDAGKPLLKSSPRPAFAVGGLRIDASLASRTLSVKATPRDSVMRPGGKTVVDVAVTDANGQPVTGAEFVTVVVDESVLALSNYATVDPLSLFYGARNSITSQVLGRDSIVLSVPDLTAIRADFGGGQDEAAAETTAAAAAVLESDAAAPVAAKKVANGLASGRQSDLSQSGGNGSPIDDRTNLDALAVFAPNTLTDANGKASVEVPLPDNVTRYRVMVVAVSGEDRFGFAENTLTARLPLTIRPSLPRFLNFGDTFDLPVVVQNQTDKAMTVDVVVQAANLKLNGDAGKRVSVPANDRVEVRFAAAADQAGAARVRVIGADTQNSDVADATTVEVPVYTPATSEAYATYGVIDRGAIEQPLTVPTNVYPQIGGLDVTTSSTALQGLTDAIIYLHTYEYKSSDALAARIIAIASLADVLDQFDAPDFPGKEKLFAQAKQDIKDLIALRRQDGGWGYWSDSQRSDAFITVQAVHALIAAKAAGLPVSANDISFGLSSLQHIEQYFPPDYPVQCTYVVRAYALYVRNLGGGRDTQGAEKLWNESKNSVPLEAAAWLWPLLSGTSAQQVAQRINNAVVETASAVTFTTGYTDNQFVTLSSDRRSDAIVLDALITQQPTSALIPKVVVGLLADRTRGRWEGAQENSFVLLALRRYFDKYETQTPNFKSQVWLGTQFAGEQAFQGRSTDRQNFQLPTAQLQATQNNPSIVINKDGSGRLYYRLGLSYAPTNLKAAALDSGFVVQRTYEAIDNKDDVTRNVDGSWKIKAGSRVRVRLTMVAESQRAQMALVDKLPAGLEVMNPELATTGPIPQDQLGGQVGGPVPYIEIWRRTWFDHQNLRDDRAEAFSAYLSAGVYDYSYVARATTPGSFVVPPAKAEEIYAPETFGRSASDVVVVG